VNHGIGTLGADRNHNPCQLSSLQKKEEAIASSCLILATPLLATQRERIYEKTDQHDVDLPKGRVD